jgi:hypothetical protein
MDGIDLAREVKMRWPLLPVILTSGYPRESVGELPPYHVSRLSGGCVCYLFVGFVGGRVGGGRGALDTPRLQDLRVCLHYARYSLAGVIVWHADARQARRGERANLVVRAKYSDAGERQSE